MRSLGTLFVILVLACNGSPTDPGSSFRGGTIVLPYGHSTQVSSDLRVTFAQVVEDSRCPASVVCAWAGNGAIRLDVIAGGGAQSVTLNTAGASNFPREGSAAGYTFTLLQLDPQPQTTDAIPPQQYRATIRVTRAG